MSAYIECERCGKHCGGLPRTAYCRVDGEDVAANVCARCWHEIDSQPRHRIPDTIDEALELMTGIQPTTLRELGIDDAPPAPTKAAGEFRDMMDQDAGTSLGDQLDEEIRRLEESDE